MTSFDEKAATWDDNPEHISRAAEISSFIRKNLVNKIVKSALEYGCGTGQLSIELEKDLPEITLMDESEKMIAVTRKKLSALGFSHLKPMHYDLMLKPLPDHKYDLIFTLLTLHHIENTALLFEKFNALLHDNGQIILIDLESEDGSFHDYEFHGHLGFERKALETQLKASGFNPISYEICYTITKEIEPGQAKNYPLFMLVAEKSV